PGWRGAGPPGRRADREPRHSGRHADPGAVSWAREAGKPGATDRDARPEGPRHRRPRRRDPRRDHSRLNRRDPTNEEKDLMFATISKRLALSATGLLLTTGLIVRSQSSEWRARLRDWMPPASAEAEHVAESPVSPCVAAEGRIVAYPGSEVVVGTEV